MITLFAASVGLAIAAAALPFAFTLLGLRR